MTKRIIFLYFIALVIRIIFAVPLVHDWDGFVFSESAKNLLKGETPYQTVVKNNPEIYPDSDKPMVQMWYAYPPLPLLMFTSPLAITTILRIPLSPLAEIFLLKLPFIAGDLLAAYLVWKFLEQKDKKLARKAELLVLFNPLLIWVSSAWGMFDIWIVNFLLLFLLSLRQSKFYRSGMCLALACLTKLFPVFFLPAIAVYVFNIIKKSTHRKQIIISFIGTLAVFITPFFLTSPRGFMNQNLLMHLIRPPQGLSIPAIVDHFSMIYYFNSGILVALSGLAMYLILVGFYLWSLVYIKKDETKLLTVVTLIYITILLFNKVTNEQYFVVLVVLLLLLRFLPKDEILIFPRKLLSLVEKFATYGVLIAAALLGFHFLTFLPPDLATSVFKTSTHNLVFYLSKHFPMLSLYVYPDSPFTYYNTPMTITTLVILPFFASAFVMVAIALKQVGKSISDIVGLLPKPSKIASFRPSIHIIVAVLLLLSSTVATLHYLAQNDVFKPIILLDDGQQAIYPQNPRVGTFYNVWWNNPSHINTLAHDSWSKTTLAPSAGYYTSKNSFYVRHIQEMKESGIDFAIVSYHLYDRKRYLTFGHYAEKLGFYYTPLIETGDVLGFDDFRPVLPDGKHALGFTPTKRSRDELKDVALSAVIENHNDKAFLRIDGKHVIFFYDSHWFFPSWDEESKEVLAQKIIDKYSEGGTTVYENITSIWGVEIASKEDLIRYFPANIPAFHDETPISKDYRAAFVQSYEEYWTFIRNHIEEQVGEVYMIGSYTPDRPNWKEFTLIPQDFSEISAFDAEYFYSPSNTWTIYRDATLEDKMSVWAKQVSQQAVRSNQTGSPLFVPVIPQYDDTKVRRNLGFTIHREYHGESLYDLTWRIAQTNQADYILITTWNEFFEGTAIEPSKEYGTKYLEATKKWTDQFKTLHNDATSSGSLR